MVGAPRRVAVIGKLVVGVRMDEDLERALNLVARVGRPRRRARAPHTEDQVFALATQARIVEVDEIEKRVTALEQATEGKAHG